MKTIKIILISLLAAVIVTCFISCEDSNIEGSSFPDASQSDPGTDEAKSTYDLLNELSRIRYKTVDLSITTQTDDIELISTYSISAERISYSVQQLNLLPENGDISDLEDGHIKTLTGSVTLNMSEIVDREGDHVALPSLSFLKGELCYDKSNFANAVEEKGKLTADVISADIFLGNDNDLKNMKITVEYDNSSLKSLILTYETEISSVTSIYTFINN